MLDFPSSPTNGQIYGGYLYSGGVWLQSGALLTPTAQTRNRIVNPAMQISQELIKSTAYTTNLGYPADQWQVASIAAGLAYACNDGGNVGPSYIFLNTTSATPSPAAGDYHMLTQAIEGLKVNDFQWGTAGARQVVLRFDAFPTVAGTIGVSLRAGDGGRSYVKNVALTTGGWNTYTVVIPGDIAGTWATSNALGMALYFALMSGSNFIGVEGWQAGSKIGASGMSNSVAAANQGVYFRNVGLYLDPQNTGVAPPFQPPDYTQELAACTRYYYKVSGGVSGTLINAGAIASGAGVAGYGSWLFPVRMRISPSLVFTNLATANVSGTMSAQSVSPDGFRTVINSAAAGTFYCVFDPIANARL